MSLRLKAASGVKWVSFSTGLVVATSFIQTAVLSRILDPGDFGVLAMIWVFMGFVQLFADMGMANAIIQKQEATHEQLSSVFWATLVVGVTAGMIGILLAPWAATFYSQPIIQQIMPVVSLSIVAAAIGQPFQMLIQRDLRFNQLAIADSISALSALLVSTVTALAGAGVWSLAYGNLAAGTTKAALLLTFGGKHWHPALHCRWADLSPFVKFGAYQIGERITNYSWSNYDYLLVGRILGAEQLGIYRIAYELVVRPLGTINPILNTVSYPVFSKKQWDNEALRKGYLELIRLVCTLTFPLLVGLAVVAPLAVDCVLGPKWQRSVPIIRILCLVGALRSLCNPSTALLLTKGMVRVGFMANLLQAIASIVVFSIAAPHGLIVLSWAATGIMIGVVLVSWQFYYTYTINLPLKDWLVAILRPAGQSALMGIVVLAVMIGMRSTILPPVIQLLLLVATGGAAYAAILGIMDRDYIHNMWKLIRGKGEP